MAKKADDPPFRREQRNPEIHAAWDISAHDIPEIRDKIKTGQTKPARDELARKTAEEHVLFDAAVTSEATRLHRKLSISTEFVDAVTPGLKARGIIAGRAKILAAVRRLKGHPPKK